MSVKMTNISQKGFLMSITPDQCRASRALLNWSQDTLAENAQVARATVNDFENSQRIPIKNNMVIIQSSMEAAGIEFIDENGGGVGVRFRELKLQYIKQMVANWDGVTMLVTFSGKSHSVVIARSIINDINRDNEMDPEKLKICVNKKLPIFLLAIENQLKTQGSEEEERFYLQRPFFNQEVF